jgi:hypothetical protein
MRSREREEIGGSGVFDSAPLNQGVKAMQGRFVVFAVAAAVLVASGGTALAAGELITRGDQIAPNVIDGGHVKAHSLARTDQQHSSLRLRVTASGGTFGDASDATVERFETGGYFVRFDRTAIIDEVAAPRNPRWLDDCAVVATPRVGGISSVGTGQDVTLVTMRGASPGSVIVAADKPNYELKRPVPVDAPFDLAAIC